MALEKEKNPFQICIWKDLGECQNCEIKGKLQCHEDFHYSAWFLVGFLSFAIPTVWGLIALYSQSGILFGAALGIWIGYLVFFFLLWEPRMLCSHCPYYAEGNTKILHCYANHGFPKTTRYKPYPMSKSEKIQFIVGVIAFIAIPLPFLIFGEQILPLLIAVGGFCLWIVILQIKICPACVNFSCPLNRVPREIVVAFLRRNPVMQAEWIKRQCLDEQQIRD